MPRSLPASPRTGEMSIGCGIPFFGIFLTVGLITGVVFFASPPDGLKPFLRASANTCRVVSSGLERVNEGVDGAPRESRVAIRFVWPADLAEEDPSFRPAEDLTWAVGDDAELRVAAYKPGARIPCYVDPSDPAGAVLERRPTADLMFVLFPFVFSGAGLGGIIWTIRSALGRSRRRRQRLKWVPDFPLERGAEGWRWSAGTSRYGAALGLTLFSVVWNGISLVPVLIYFDPARRAERETPLLVFGLVFLLIGLLVIYGAIRAWLVAVRVPITRVVASRPSVAPGGSLDLVIQQPGRFPMRRVHARVSCSEHATFTVGTDTRTETHLVFERTLGELHDVNPAAGRPAELRARLAIPDDAMHSFEGARNQVRWALHVKGELDGWPDFEHTFPFAVLPDGAARDREEA